MDEKEYRQKQIEWDKKDLNGKVRRWKKIPKATYDAPLPRLLWEYVTMADSMYIHGYSVGVILLCAAVLELILADQLISNMQMTAKEVQRFSLAQMAIISHRQSIINGREKREIKKIRKRRNAIIHVNVGQLDKMVKQTHRVEGLEAEFYLQPIDDDSGIHEDALASVIFTRDLSVKFYGHDS